MGAVWMAEQKEPVKRKVAVKLVKAGMDIRKFWRDSKPNAKHSP